MSFRQLSGNQFTGTTALGIGSLSGANNLWQLSLATGPLGLLGGIFQLNITFTAPTGIAGGQGTNYIATVLGSVSPNVDQGGVNIQFQNPTQTFTFSDGLNTGSFSLTVADLFVQTGRAANLTAGFTGQQAPAGSRAGHAAVVGKRNYGNRGQASPPQKSEARR